MSALTELTPAIRHLAEDFRRRLGKLDPQQVAIWREMTPAQKIELAFQMYDFARRVVWTTERQAAPDASPEELTWRVLRRMHGRALLNLDDVTRWARAAGVEGTWLALLEAAREETCGE
jgi:hypothetical protein